MTALELPQDLLVAECRALRALARQLTRDPHAADDAVQDTLVAALTRPAVGNVRCWLEAVLRNSLRQQRRGERRRQGREAGSDGSGAAPSAAEVCEQLELHRLLLAMVQALDPALRQTLFLRFWRGMSVREIGSALGLPATTVAGRVERGLLQLRRQLDGEHGGRRAWVPWLLQVAEVYGGFAGGALLMKTKLLFGASLLVALFALLPFVWPGADPVPAPNRQAPPAMQQAAPPGTVDLPPPQRQAVEPAPMPQPVRVDAAAQVRGRVLDVQGQGIAGVAVRFERLGSDGAFEPDPEVTPVASGLDGSFTIGFAGREGWLVGSDVEWATVRRAWLPKEMPPEPSIVVVAPSRSYRGIVVDPDGAAVPGARVVILVSGRMVPTLAVANAAVALPNDLGAVITDAQGHFAFERIGWMPGSHFIAEHDRFGPAKEALPEASAHDLVLRLRAASDEQRVYGVVIDATGGPAAGTLVSVGADSAVTGNDGWFAVPWTGKQPPKFVRAVKTDVGACSARLLPGADQPGFSASRPITLRLPDAPGAVQGRVVDSEGQPQAGVRVWTPDLTWLGNVTREEQGHQLSFGTSLEGMCTAANRATGPQSAYSITTTSDRDGRFVLRGLLPRSYPLFAMSPGTLLAAGPVEAGPGETVELRLEPPSLRTVAGRVLSQQGAALAGVRIGLGRKLAWRRPERQEDPWTGSPTMPGPAANWFQDGGPVTDANGRFQLEHVQVEGTYLTFSGDIVFGGTPFELDGARELEQLEVRVDARSTFRIELQDAGEADAFRFARDGDRHVPLFVRVESYVMSMGQVDLFDGRSPEAYTPSGKVTVVLLKKGQEVRRAEVELRPGGVHAVRL